MPFNDTDFCGYGVMRAPKRRAQQPWDFKRPGASLRSLLAAAGAWILMALMLAAAIAVAVFWAGSASNGDDQ